MRRIPRLRRRSPCRCHYFELYIKAAPKIGTAATRPALHGQILCGRTVILGLSEITKRGVRGIRFRDHASFPLPGTGQTEGGVITKPYPLITISGNNFLLSASHIGAPRTVECTTAGSVSLLLRVVLAEYILHYWKTNRVCRQDSNCWNDCGGDDGLVGGKARFWLTFKYSF